MSGLYDQGFYIDSIKNIHSYEAQELSYAEDLACYDESFFVSNEEKEFVMKQSMFVTEIENAILKCLENYDNKSSV